MPGDAKKKAHQRANPRDTKKKAHQEKAKSRDEQSIRTQADGCTWHFEHMSLESPSLR